MAEQLTYASAQFWERREQAAAAQTPAARQGETLNQASRDAERLADGVVALHNSDRARRQKLTP